MGLFTGGLIYIYIYIDCILCWPVISDALRDHYRMNELFAIGISVLELGKAKKFLSFSRNIPACLHISLSPGDRQDKTKKYKNSFGLKQNPYMYIS